MCVLLLIVLTCTYKTLTIGRSFDSEFLKLQMEEGGWHAASPSSRPRKHRDLLAEGGVEEKSLAPGTFLVGKFGNVDSQLEKSTR